MTGFCYGGGMTLRAAFAGLAIDAAAPFYGGNPPLETVAQVACPLLLMYGREDERLIGDLLDLARLEGGGGSLRIEEVPVAQLFDRVSARHERACQDAGVTMVAAIDPGAETISGDRDRLEQALQNLAANAVRYAPRGSHVRLASRLADDSVALSVEDEGAAGIAPEHLPHVFDRFYKADASRPFDWAQGAPNGAEERAGVSGGSGLGLSIVKAIVERHGGRISISSRPGRTVFEMVLPRRTALASAG